MSHILVIHAARTGVTRLVAEAIATAATAGGLATVPVAVFGLASTRTDAAWERNRAGLDRALERHAWLVPVAVALFDTAPPGRHPIRTGLVHWTPVGDWARKLVALVD
jgi:menaquinone-dependent protoporphyrinogen IX oxidase